MADYLEIAKNAKVGAKEATKAKKGPVPEAPANVTNIINTAGTIRRAPDERRLVAAGWTPKDGCGPNLITIWESPTTGFYCSREIALYRHDAVRQEGSDL